MPDTSVCLNKMPYPIISSYFTKSSGFLLNFAREQQVSSVLSNIITLQGTLAPPTFKPIYSRRFFWDIWVLCAVAWANVAEACPGM